MENEQIPVDPNATITAVRFEPGMTFRGKVADYRMVAALSDGSEDVIGHYYTDEKSYTEADFMGLTLEGANKKFLFDDKKFLQS